MKYKISSGETCDLIDSFEIEIRKCDVFYRNFLPYNYSNIQYT